MDTQCPPKEMDDFPKSNTEIRAARRFTEMVQVYDFNVFIKYAGGDKFTPLYTQEKKKSILTYIYYYYR